MNDDMKMILFSDLHYLDDNHKEKTNRKLTKLAIPVIEELIYEINQKIKPDICVNLGDLIEDTEDYKQDIMNYDFAYTKLKEIKCPLYFVVGNHDLRSLNNENELLEILNYDNLTFSIDVNNYHLVFLGLNINSNLENNDGGINRTNTISEKDLKWLKYDLNNTKLPILIFCHYGIAEDDMNGNWWFSKDSESALLKNRKQIKEIIKKHNILAVFSGHQHWTKKINEDKLDYYIIGSLTEDINNNGIPDAVYYVVSLNDDNIDVKEQHIKL